MANGDCPLTFLLFGLAAVRGSSLLLRVWFLLYTHLLLVQMVLEEG